jgi:hypothetical protein
MRGRKSSRRFKRENNHKHFYSKMKIFHFLFFCETRREKRRKNVSGILIIGRLGRFNWLWRIDSFDKKLKRQLGALKEQFIAQKIKNFKQKTRKIRKLYNFPSPVTLLIATFFFSSDAPSNKKIIYMLMLRL